MAIFSDTNIQTFFTISSLPHQGQPGHCHNCSSISMKSKFCLHFLISTNLLHNFLSSCLTSFFSHQHLNVSLFENQEVSDMNQIKFMKHTTQIWWELNLLQFSFCGWVSFRGLRSKLWDHNIKQVRVFIRLPVLIPDLVGVILIMTIMIIFSWDKKGIM